MLKKSIAGAAVVAMVLTLSACGGSSTKTTVNSAQTQGQQLLDLKAAYDQGVITEKEYKRTKKEILD